MTDPEPSTSKLSIAAITCAFVGILFGPAMFIAIVLGHLARNETRNAPHLKGRGLATTTLIVGYAWLAIVVTCVIIAVSASVAGKP